MDKKDIVNKELLAEVRQKWLSIRFSTEPANRSKAEDGVDLAYKNVGLTPPNYKIWVNSPYEAKIADFILHLVGEDTSLPHDPNNYQVKEQEDLNRIGRHLIASIDDKSIQAEIQRVIDGSIFPEDFKSESITSSSWAYYEYFEKSHHIDNEVKNTIKALRGVMDVTENACNVWVPFETVAILVERPVAMILLDEDKPGMKFKDGTVYYC